MTASRRLARLLTMVLCVAVSVTTVPAAAQANTLAERIEAVEEASYAGRRIVYSTWDGESVVELFDIEHRSGLTVVTATSNDTVVSTGKVIGEDGGGNVLVQEWTALEPSDRYSIRRPESSVYLGRPAEAFEVWEGATLRGLFIVDDETGAPLSTQFYDAGGAVYRVAYMVTFSPTASIAMPVGGPMSAEYDVLVPAATTLPQRVAGYLRADAYRSADESVHAFYSDGLFTFSVFQLADDSRPREFESARTFTVGQTAYRRIVSPGEIWVHWTADGHSFILVGDLPPDHLDAVLRRLPRSPERGFFDRIWHGLFG